MTCGGKISLGGPSKPFERLAKPRSMSTAELGKKEEWGPQRGPESVDKSLHEFVNQVFRSLRRKRSVKIFPNNIYVFMCYSKPEGIFSSNTVLHKSILKNNALVDDEIIF